VLAEVPIGWRLSSDRRQGEPLWGLEQPSVNEYPPPFGDTLVCEVESVVDRIAGRDLPTMRGPSGLAEDGCVQWHRGRVAVDPVACQSSVRGSISEIGADPKMHRFLDDLRCLPSRHPAQFVRRKPVGKVMALQEERVQVVQDVGRIASSSLVHLEYAPKADLHTLPLVLPQPPRVMLALLRCGLGRVGGCRFRRRARRRRRRTSRQASSPGGSRVTPLTPFKSAPRSAAPLRRAGGIATPKPNG
jgi:hypothetical protein